MQERCVQQLHSNVNGMQWMNGRIVYLTVADAAHVRIGKDEVLAEVCKTTGLLDECWRQTVSVCLVMDELRGNIVVNLKLASIHHAFEFEMIINTDVVLQMDDLSERWEFTNI